MSNLAAGAWTRLLAPRILAVLIALIGALLMWWGVQLAALGGSFY